MRFLRISLALSISLLSFVPHASAAGDPNLDTGVGTASSRGPYGFNNTGNIPMYDQPYNNYGVYRDVYGGFRDSGMIPDNAFVKVPELTWEQAHPPGPPKLMGSPGGLGGVGMGGGFLGGGLLGLGFPLGTSLGAFGSFTATSPLAAAAAASLVNPLPVSGGTGLGPLGSNPRTAYGFAGTQPSPYASSYNYLGGRYLGPLSGNILNPNFTATNSTAANGSSTTRWSWQTAYGPATLDQVASALNNQGQQTVTDTFTLNGNSYRTQTVINAPPLATTGTSGTGTGGTSTGTTATANMALFPGFNFLPTPPVNGSINSNFQSGNAQQNPLANYSPQNWVNQNYLAQTSSGGNFGSTYTAPQTMGQPQSVFWTNNYGVGSFGSMYASPSTDGTQRSVLFNGNFNSGNFGGMFPSPATDGTQWSFRYPNPDINNGIGTGGGSLAAIGFGLPGYATPNYSSLFPGLAAGGYGYGGVAGSPYVGMPTGGMGSGLANNFPSNGALSGAGTANVNGNFNAAGTLITNGNGNFNENCTAGGAGGSYMNGATGTNEPSAVNNVGAGTTGNGTGTGGAANAVNNPFAQNGPPAAGQAGIGTVTGQPAGAIAGSWAPNQNQVSTQFGVIERTPAGTGTEWMTQSSAQPQLLPPGLLQPTRQADVANGRRPLPVCSNTPDGACGFFGGGPAVATALDIGLKNDFRLPYLGYPVTPLGMYSAARNLAIRLDNQSLAAGPISPTTTLATDWERKLAERRLPLDKALGRVIGSMRFANGDILTYGTGGTLHLAADNSGSLTFNDGEVVTFTRADPCLRRIALQSTLIF